MDKYKLKSTILVKTIITMLVGGLFSLNAGFSVPSYGKNTLAVQSFFKPILDIVPGIKDTLEFNMKDRGKTKSGEDERKWEFWRYVGENSIVYQRSSGLLRGKMHELIDNAYDSIVDRIDELKISPEKYTAMITIKAEYHGESLVLIVDDNGKPVSLKKDGKPIARYKDPKRHFGGANYGKTYLTAGLSDPEKDIIWEPRINGTRVSVKIPKEKIIEAFYIQKEEVVIAEELKPFQGKRTKTRKEAERVYLDLFKEKAESLGLSREGIKTLVREHINQFFETGEEREVMFNSDMGSGIQKGDEAVSAPQGQKLWGRVFIDTALLRAYEAKRRYKEGRIKSPDILIGSETSWIPERQLPYIQELLNELSRLSREKGIDNLIIRRGKGFHLASILEREAGERNIPDSNIIILGERTILDSGAFDVFRDGIAPEKWAFFAGVELPENFPDNNYIRLLEMLTDALNMWSGMPQPEDTSFMKIVQENKRIYRFIIPGPEPVDYDLLKEIYAGQLKLMKSA